MKKRDFISFCALLAVGWGVYRGIRYYNKRLSKIETSSKELKESFVESELMRFYLRRGKDLRRFYGNDGCDNVESYIAHGGGIGSFTYTNSLEAVIDSIYNQGFRFVEIDFLETTDGKLVGAHDWRSFRELTGLSGEGPLSSSEIRKAKIKGRYSPIFAEDLRDLMLKQEDFFVVTDKIRNYRLISKELPQLNRVIVEVFDLLSYVRAVNEGIEYPAFSLRAPSDIELVKKYRFPIVTIQADKFFDSEENIRLVQQLHNEGVTIFLAWATYLKKDDPTWIRKY